MRIPSGEMAQFADTEQAYHKTAMSLIDLAEVQLPSQVRIEPFDDMRLISQRVSSPIIPLSKNAQGETGNFLGRVDGLYQVFAPETHRMTDELHGVPARFRLRVVTGVETQQPQVIERPPFVAVGCLHSILEPFAARYFGIEFTEELERTAHSSQEREKQSAYGKWLELMKAATIG